MLITFASKKTIWYWLKTEQLLFHSKIMNLLFLSSQKSGVIFSIWIFYIFYFSFRFWFSTKNCKDQRNWDWEKFSEEKIIFSICVNIFEEQQEKIFFPISKFKPLSFLVWSWNFRRYLLIILFTFFLLCFHSYKLLLLAFINTHWSNKLNYGSSLLLFTMPSWRNSLFLDKFTIVKFPILNLEFVSFSTSMSSFDLAVYFLKIIGFFQDSIKTLRMVGNSVFLNMNINIDLCELFSQKYEEVIVLFNITKKCINTVINIQLSYILFLVSFRNIFP